MRLTLSFDNGPDPEVTPRVLDGLREHRASAYFFVLGKLVDTPFGPPLVRRALAEGHLVGNHSFTHSVPLGDDPRPEAVAAEIAATEALLAPLVAGERLFRPFGGGGVLGPHLLSAAAARYLQENAYTCVLWNSVPRDWVEPQGWADTALADLARREHTLLVLHDIQGACLDRLDGFLREARARGAEFTLDLPPGCVPIAKGRVTGDIASITRNTPS